MKAVEQIDMINTAIRLGDPVVPPVGARVRLFGPGTNVWDFNVGWRNDVLWRVSAVRGTKGLYRCDLRVQTPARAKRKPKAASSGITVLFPNDNGSFLQVVWLPKDLPPFEKWPRWA